MIKSIFNFFQIKMEMMFRNATILIQPVFRKTPESLNSIKVIPPFWFPFLFSDYNMIPSDRQGTIGMPIISVIQASWFCMLSYYRQQRCSISRRNRKRKYSTIPLIQTKDHLFAGCAPATFASTLASKHRFIHLNFSRNVCFLKFNKCLIINCLTNCCKNFLDSLQRYLSIFLYPICWYSQNKKIKYMTYFINWDIQFSQISACKITKFIAALSTLISTIFQLPEDAITTSWASSSVMPAKLFKKYMTFPNTGYYGNWFYGFHLLPLY